MPTEYRLIQFKEKEIETAIDRWLRASGELNQYSRSGVLAVNETKKQVTIETQCWDIREKDKGNSWRRRLTTEEVRQAIVLYCKDHQIPLSRQGKKAIRVLDKQVALYYMLS